LNFHHVDNPLVDASIDIKRRVLLHSLVVSKYAQATA
jgi:hypothetical protein